MTIADVCDDCVGLLATIVYINCTVCTALDGQLCTNHLLLLLVGSHVHSLGWDRQVNDIGQGRLLLCTNAFVAPNIIQALVPSSLHYKLLVHTCME